MQLHVSVQYYDQLYVNSVCIYTLINIHLYLLLVVQYRIFVYV